MISKIAGDSVQRLRILHLDLATRHGDQVGCGETREMATDNRTARAGLDGELFVGRQDRAIAVGQTQQRPRQASRETRQDDILDQPLEIRKAVGNSHQYPVSKNAVACHVPMKLNRRENIGQECRLSDTVRGVVTPLHQAGKGLQADISGPHPIQHDFPTRDCSQGDAQRALMKHDKAPAGVSGAKKHRARFNALSCTV